MPARNQFLADIIVTAVDGGINYWATFRSYRIGKSTETGIAAVICDTENDNAQYELTLEVIEKGIAKIISPGFQLRKDILLSILLGNRNNDAGEIDSEAADCIVQAGLFGDVIYG